MRKILWFLIGLVLVAGVAWFAGAQVTSDVLTWERPTARTDGSALAASEILQYRITWSKVAGGPYTDGTATAPGNALTFTRTPRPSGRFCYVIATTDTGSIIGPNSNEACVEKCPLAQRVNAAGDCVLIPPPNAPTNVRAT